MTAQPSIDPNTSSLPFYMQSVPTTPSICSLKVPAFYRPHAQSKHNKISVLGKHHPPSTDCGRDELKRTYQHSSRSNTSLLHTTQITLSPETNTSFHRLNIYYKTRPGLPAINAPQLLAPPPNIKRMEPPPTKRPLAMRTECQRQRRTPPLVCASLGIISSTHLYLMRDASRAPPPPTFRCPGCAGPCQHPRLQQHLTAYPILCNIVVRDIYSQTGDEQGVGEDNASRDPMATL